MPSICQKTNQLKRCVPMTIPKATIAPEPSTITAYMNPIKGELSKVPALHSKKKEEPPAPAAKADKPHPLPAERLIKRLFHKNINKKESSAHKAKVIEDVIVDSFLKGSAQH